MARRRRRPLRAPTWIVFAFAVAATIIAAAVFTEAGPHGEITLPTLPSVLSSPAPTAQPETGRPDAAKARRQLGELRVANKGSLAGYDREAYGQRWADVDRNGCDTRNDILARDLTGERKEGRCVVVAGTLKDPYTGTTIEFAKADAAAVQIDHVYPLALSWRMSAARWTEERRTSFANDPDNLLAVDGSANQSKGDSGPEAWRPRKPFHCAYAARYIGVAAEYDLPITIADHTALDDMLDTCPK